MDAQIKALSRGDLMDIEQAYYEALESNANSFGNHWILIGKLGQHGFRTSSPNEAMKVAERIVERWYILR